MTYNYSPRENMKERIMGQRERKKKEEKKEEEGGGEAETNETKQKGNQ